MTTATAKKTAPKTDTKVTGLAFWENMKDTSPEAMFAIGEAVAVADTAIEGAPVEYATRCAEIASAILYGPRGTQADIIKGVAKGKGIAQGAAKMAVVRFGHVGRILIAHPGLDPLAVRKFVRDAKVEDITRAIDKGDLSAPKAPGKKAPGKKAPAKRGPGKSSAKDVTLHAQVVLTTQANAKCVVMAKVPAEIPVEDLKLLKASLDATLKAVEGMLAVAVPAKPAKATA
jgi:hypothetical protein